jgi:2,4-dienoyl-CoA reductase-like NADH-dependent reductase (Old Yellow Enzyme family)
MSKYKELFSPITVGGVRIKNRIMMSAMDTNYGNADGSMSERLHA